MSQSRQESIAASMVTAEVCTDSDWSSMPTVATTVPSDSGSTGSSSSSVPTKATTTLINSNPLSGPRVIAHQRRHHGF